MKFKGLLVVALLFVPSLCPAASKEIQELQRDVAQLQDMVRTMQQSQNEKLAAMQVLVQQALDASNKAHTAVAVLDSSIRQTLKEQERSVVGPVAGVGGKVDQMATAFQALQESVNDISQRISKLQAQMVDVQNAVKTINAPPPPPPGGGGVAPGGAAGSVPPAEVLFTNAKRDQVGGKMDLALSEYSDYLKFYPSTDLAPNAQYSIGEIHFNQGDYDAAVKEFDMVLEKYPDNQKTADALFMKGQALVKLGQRTKGAQEFLEVIKRFPGSPQAEQACTQRKNLGLQCGVAARSTPGRAGRAPVRKKK